MAKFQAVEEAQTPGNWTIYKRVERRVFGYLASYEWKFHSSVWKKTDEEVRAILKNLECPRTMTFEDSCQTGEQT